jgi:hypothetical protein
MFALRLCLVIRSGGIASDLFLYSYGKAKPVRTSGGRAAHLAANRFQFHLKNFGKAFDDSIFNQVISISCPNNSFIDVTVSPSQATIKSK